MMDFWLCLCKEGSHDEGRNTEILGDDNDFDNIDDIDDGDDDIVIYFPNTN